WKKLIFVSVLVGLYFSLGRPIVHTASYSVAGGLAMQNGRESVESLDFSAAADQFKLAQEHFSHAHKASTGSAWAASLVGMKQSQQEVERGLAALAATADGLQTLSLAGKPWPAQLKALLQFQNPTEAPSDVHALLSQSKVE